VLRHFEMVDLAAIAQPTCYEGFACGGAVFVSGGGNLTAEHGIFRNNTAGDGADGGAIKVMTGPGAVGTGAVVLRFLTFRENRAFFGGAVNIQGSGIVRMYRCVLDTNVALNSGGALRANLGGPGAPAGKTSLAIRESEFTNNSASTGGGALSLIMGGAGAKVVSLVDCRGAGNAARSGAAISQLRQNVSLSEADMLIGADGAAGAVADSRWGLISFRTSTRTSLALPVTANAPPLCSPALTKGCEPWPDEQSCLSCAKANAASLAAAGCTQASVAKLCAPDSACELPALPLLHAVKGDCPQGAAVIPNGSSCIPAVCTTAKLGSTVAATCDNGMLLWKNGCACGIGEHDAPNSVLPDTGVCADGGPTRSA
jgi:hypothetical protein